MKRRFLVPAYLAAILASCGPSPTTVRDGREVIAVVPKGTSHRFWRTVEAGARAAGNELGVEIIWKGPLKENDRAGQIALVEQFVAQRISGIVLAPLDDTALIRPTREARRAGIPVLIFDTGLKGEPGVDFVSFVATDNRAAGRLAGAEMARLVRDGGRVGVLRYQVGSGSTSEREEGFLEHVRSRPSLEVILENQYGGVTMGETIQKSEEILDVLRQIDGVFCPTEPTASGLLVALRKHGLAGQVRIVGFDSSEELVEALHRGEIDALVLQEPWKMGYQAVASMVAHLRGDTVPARIDTGSRIVNRANLHEFESELRAR